MYRFEDIPAEPEKLLKESDVSFYRASGPGGQHRNKTETAVRIVHRPTGVTAVAADERSQSRNRALALERLHGKLVRALKPRKARKATRTPRSEKEKRLRAKVRVAKKKKLRRSASEE